MAAYSKLLSYRCHELVHTWHHSCTKCSFDIFMNSGCYGLKIYGVVYLLTALVSKKKLSKKYAIQLLKNYLQSVLFLAFNGSYFVASFCVVRRILGHINFLSAGWLPGFLASYLSIYVERKSRRSLLAIYVTNVASECVWNVLKARGYVKPFPKGEVLLFALSMALFGYYFKTSAEFSPLINSIFKIIMGKGESGTPSVKVRDSKVVSKGQWKHRKCPHRGPCISNVLKMAASGWLKGYTFQVCLKLITSLPMIIKYPLLLVPIFASGSAIKMGAFIAWFSAVFRGTCCVCRWVTDEDKPIHGAYAGGLASLGMLFSSSPSLAMYAAWKAIEALYGSGIKEGYVPYIPGGIEFLYAFSTAYLFHLAVMEKFNLKPSYWRFLLTLTGGKFNTYNSALLDCYGLDSGRGRVWPTYNEKYLSQEFIDKHLQAK